MNDPEYWITAQQVAARVALTPATIKKWANEGKITAYKIGKSVRFKASDVDKLGGGGAEVCLVKKVLLTHTRPESPHHPARK